MQLPLAKGDAIFFNPALFHGAGTNVTADIQRMANLLQVSSAFGRAMETVDRAAMCRRASPGLLACRRPARADGVANVTPPAEGYAFPTNLDLDADRRPGTRDQALVLARAVDDGWSEAPYGACRAGRPSPDRRRVTPRRFRRR